MTEHHSRVTIEEVTLECGDTALYYPSPKRGDIVYCRKCAKWRRVIQLEQDKKWIKIACRDCSHARHFPLNRQDDAYVKGETHSLRYGHVVELIDGHGKIIVIAS